MEHLSNAGATSLTYLPSSSKNASLIGCLRIGFSSRVGAPALAIGRFLRSQSVLELLFTAGSHAQNLVVASFTSVGRGLLNGVLQMLTLAFLILVQPLLLLTLLFLVD